MLDEHRGSGTYTPREEDHKKSDKDPEGKIANGTEKQHTESRLLTKKQLSDMAFGIRELSKKLSHVTLKLKVRNIFVLTKAHDESLVVHTRELAEWLLKKDPLYTVWVEDKLEEDSKFDVKRLLASGDKSWESRLKYWDNNLCAQRPNTFDIVLGVSCDIFSYYGHILTTAARGRRHSLIRLMALPARRSPSPCIQHGFPRLSHQIRLRQVS
jgi:NAD+ kinase